MPEPTPTPTHVSHTAHDWRSLLASDLRALAVRRHWGRALMAIGWVHLGCFAVCQEVYASGERRPWVSIVLWATEILAVFGTVRVVAGRHWLAESPTVALVARVWVTFLILSFNVASFNEFVGWQTDWFKAVWCTLASFGFATMAWLFGYRLLVPAFQMYFTGLLVVRYPQWAYLINGGSWCLALQYLGLDLIRRRQRLLNAGRGIEAPPAPEVPPPSLWSSAPALARVPSRT